MTTPTPREGVWDPVGDARPISFRARILPPSGGEQPVRFAGWLTPYDVETIAMAAKRMGLGARLELILAPRASEGSLAKVREQFAWLDTRGIEVRVERADPRGV